MLLSLFWPFWLAYLSFGSLWSSVQGKHDKAGVLQSSKAVLLKSTSMAPWPMRPVNRFPGLTLLLHLHGGSTGRVKWSRFLSLVNYLFASFF